jgi:predicted nucleic acid-binding protein
MLNSSEIFLNTVTVMEVAHYLTRSLDANTAREKIDAVVNLSSLRILDFDKDTLNASIDLLSKHGRSKGLGGRDSTILASIIQNNIDTLLTHDNVLKNVSEIQGIRIIDPVDHI